MDLPNRSKTSLGLVATALVLLAAILALVGSVGACGVEAKAYLNLMSAVPMSCGHFTYWDTAEIDDDPHLWPISDKFEESAAAKQVDDLIPVLSRVKQSAKAVSYENATAPNPATLLRGDFDAKFVKGRLETMGYIEKLYKNVGIWTLQDGQTPNSVALKYPTILVGDATGLEAYIDVVTKGNAQSLDEDPDIQMLTERLPNGVIVGIDRASPTNEEQYANLVAYGKSYTKADKDTLKVTAVYLFANGPAAGSAQEDIEDYLEDGFEQIKVKRDGNFIIATAQISISEFAESLTF